MAWLEDSHGDIIVFSLLSIMRTYSLVTDTSSIIKLMVSIVIIEDATGNYEVKKISRSKVNISLVTAYLCVIRTIEYKDAFRKNVTASSLIS